MRRTGAMVLVALLLSAVAVLGLVAPARADAMPIQYQVTDLGRLYDGKYVPRINNNGTISGTTPQTAGDYTLEQRQINAGGYGDFAGNYLFRAGSDVNLLPQDLQGIRNPFFGSTDITVSTPSGGYIKYVQPYIEPPFPNIVGVNSSGHVIGSFYGADWYKPVDTTPFFFAPETGQRTPLKSLPGVTDHTPTVDAINDRDQIVGTQGGNAIFYSSPTAVPVELTKLIGTDTGWTFEIASGINDRGEVVGQGINPDGVWTDFKLEPTTVPEPASFTVFAILALPIRLLVQRRGNAIPRAKDAV